MDSNEQIISDFNEIAELGDEPKWNHNNCYYGELLRLLPPQADVCLDIGCGKGELACMLSVRASEVVAVDISDKMIEYAERINAAPNIKYVRSDIFDADIKDCSLDAIVTAATAHHLSLSRLFEFSKVKLKPGGRLIILDLAKPSSLTDYILWGFAIFPNIVMNILKNGRLHKDDPHTAALWRINAEHDVYMTIAEVKGLARRHLNGAKVSRKLYWRYMLVWSKP